MCDTLAVRFDSGVWFAKNSDRDPDEVQRVEFHAAGEYPETIQTTHGQVEPLVRLRQAVIIGRPAWMWGAEMGVNAAGVAIGNEAVFTRLVRRHGDALLGMDLVRLGLEQGTTAEAAAEIIIRYLEAHGQGGTVSRHHPRFRYDNSFLIADSRGILKLETAGRFWALQQIRQGDALSNALTITTPTDSASFPERLSRYGEWGFARAFSTRLMPWMARASERRAQSLRLLESLQARRADSSGEVDLIEVQQQIARHLASHRHAQPTGNHDICMHARGWLRPSATVNGFIAWLPHRGSPLVWMTGAPNPCRNPFHEVTWGSDHFFARTPGYWESRAQS